jgi:hypothetical protein
MAYADIADLANDSDFHGRNAACIEQEPTFPPTSDPTRWASENRWALAASPGFGDAYASAVVGEVERPGRDPSVISDAMILSAVQARMAELVTGPEIEEEAA